VSVDGERIPPSWTWVELGEVAESVRNGMYVSRPGAVPDGVPILRIGAVRPMRLDLSDLRYTGMRAGEVEERDGLLNPGDLLFTRYNGNPEFVGACARVPDGVDHLAYPDKLIRVRLTPGVFDSRFVCYMWASEGVRRQVRQFVKTSAGQVGIAGGSLKKVRLPLPPLAEQHRIVEALEEQLSRLGMANSQVNSAKARASALVGRVLDDLVLGEGWRSRGPLSESSLQQLGPSKTNRFRYESLPQLPPEWRWRRAEDVCERIFCGSTPKAHLMHGGSGDIPFLKVYNIMKAGGLDFTVNPTFVDVGTHEGLLKRSRVLPGDVVTNIVGPPLGKTALIPSLYPEWNINQAIVAFRGGDSVAPEWLALVLRSTKVLSLLQATAKATAGQFNVALSTCRDLPIPVPPADEQRRIGIRGQMLLDGIERLGSASSTLRRRADALHRAVLLRAFEGALVAQDPGDESASALLARIAAKRAAQPRSKGARKAVVRKTPRARTPRDAVTTGPVPQPTPAPEPTPTPTFAVQQEFDL